MRPLRRAVTAAVLSVLLPAAAHAHCGAEGCPIVRPGLNTGYGRLSFDLRFQDVTQDKLWNGTSETTLDDVIADTEAHGEVELYTHTRSWVGEFRGAITPRLSVVATLPFIERQHQHWLRHTPIYNPAFVSSWDYQGLGDLAVVGRYDVLRRGAGDVLSLGGGIKAPTGRTHVPGETQDNFGFESTLEPSARPGTGSWDWIVGASLAKSLPWRRAIPISANVLGKINTKGTDDFKVGNELQVGVAGGYMPISRVTLLGQINFSDHGSDLSADPNEAAHTGASSLFLSPGVTVNAATGISVYALYQARVWGRSDEPTVVASDHFLIGTSFALGH